MKGCMIDLDKPRIGETEILDLAIASCSMDGQYRNAVGIF